MSGNPVGWFEIYVEDLERAKTFYEAVLGLKLDRLDSPDPGIGGMYSFPMDPHGAGATGALVKMDGGPSHGNTTIVYFKCEDCSVEAARVKPSGGKIMKDKFAIGPHGFIALATDTEGNTFGLHSMH